MLYFSESRYSTDICGKKEGLYEDTTSPLDRMKSNICVGCLHFTLEMNSMILQVLFPE